MDAPQRKVGHLSLFLHLLFAYLRCFDLNRKHKNNHKTSKHETDVTFYCLVKKNKTSSIKSVLQ